MSIISWIFFFYFGTFFSQEWVLGKPIGLGGFGELYLAALKTNGLLSPENYVIKVGKQIELKIWKESEVAGFFLFSHTADRLFLALICKG